MLRQEIEIKVEYHLLDGTVTNKTKNLRPIITRDRFPILLKEGGFISQADEEPQGMFVISKVDEENKKFTLKEVDCDPIHWKGDENGRGYGPDEECKQKECQFLLTDCPISAHLMMTVDLE